MFKIAFNAFLGITALMIYSWGTLFFLPPTARDARWSNKRNIGGLTLLFCIVSGLVWYFQRNENQGAAKLTLYSSYMLLFLCFLWAVRKGRWN